MLSAKQKVRRIVGEAVRSISRGRGGEDVLLLSIFGIYLMVMGQLLQGSNVN